MGKKQMVILWQYKKDQRWVSLFCQTIDELFSGPVAEQAKIRAQSMAMALQVKIHALTTAKP